MKPIDSKHLLNDDAKAFDDVFDAIMEAHAEKEARHIVRKLTDDEVRIADALDYYDHAQKDPRNGMLHRLEANQIACRLAKCSDDTLYQMAQPGENPRTMANARGVFMQLARIILKKKGLQVAQGWT